VVAAVVKVFERSEFIGTGYYSDAAFFDRRIVEVDYGGDHGMKLVREVGEVLMHWKWCTFGRRFDKHLAVVELDVGSDDIGGPARQAGIADQTCEGGKMVLDVVALEELSWEVGYFGTGGPAFVGDAFGIGLLQSVGDLMCLVAELDGFVVGEDGFGEGIAVFCIEVLFPGGEPELAVDFNHGFST
tara:strand:- start:988 stop:1545 length:558 start_codon:yes stop_codon:yes gene_type:complete